MGKFTAALFLCCHFTGDTLPQQNLGQHTFFLSFFTRNTSSWKFKACSILFSVVILHFPRKFTSGHRSFVIIPREIYSSMVSFFVIVQETPFLRFNLLHHTFSFVYLQETNILSVNLDKHTLSFVYLQETHFLRLNLQQHTFSRITIFTTGIVSLR